MTLPHGGGPRRPLSRFTVLDLTRVRTGPTAVRQLSDWGARVIKIEGPGEDDMTGARDGSDFQNLNRNTRSLVLDLKKPAGRDVFLRLCGSADVVIENFRPDVKHRLGIDYESVRAANSRVVYASISGFGQDGPYRERPGFDQIAQAIGGMMSVNGVVGQGPLRVGVPIADLCSGLYCALGILTALLDREVTGEGQWVQTSLLQAQIAMLDLHAATWLIDGKVPRQSGNNHPYTVPMGVYPAADGEVVIGASGQEQFRKFCRAIGCERFLDDPRFASAEARTANVDAFTEELGEVTKARPRAEWVEILNAAGIACGSINSVDQAFSDPQVESHGMARPIRHRRRGDIRVLGTPVAMSNGESVIDRPAPDKGEHTDAVLTEAGWSEAEIAGLRRHGVVA